MHGVARTFTNDMACGYSDTGVCHLSVTVNVKFGGRYFFCIGKVYDTRFYRGETMPHRNFLQCIIRRCQQEGYEQYCGSD